MSEIARSERASGRPLHRLARPCAALAPFTATAVPSSFRSRGPPAILKGSKRGALTRGNAGECGQHGERYRGCSNPQPRGRNPMTVRRTLARAACAYRGRFHRTRSRPRTVHAAVYACVTCAAPRCSVRHRTVSHAGGLFQAPLVMGRRGVRHALGSRS
jgi:hypothetical protein